MNRCLHFSRPLALLALIASLGCALLGAPVQAQTHQRIPPIAKTAQRGVLVVTAPPEVLLNGQAARLSPGARIRGTNNLLLMSGTLVGQELTVGYVRDTLGLLHEVWILTEAEAQTLARRQP